MPSLESQTLPRSASTAAQTRRWWRLPWEAAATLGAFAYWGIFGLLFTLVSIPLILVLPCLVAKRLGRGMLHRAFRVFVGYLRATDLVQADLSSLDALKDDPRAVIIAPNHTSLWDAVFVISKLPQPICIMKEAILKNPFLGGGARLAGYIPNGSSSRMVKDAADALQKGGQLLLFPEGTRTRREARWINPLRGGCALIARRAGVPVRPVFIRSNTRFLEKGWPLWKKPEFPIRISIELGDPVVPEEGETAHEFTKRLEEIYQRNLSRAHKLRRQVEVAD
ncbi:1-acyl-sn-glycerol-3-phosphate acyltransferase [Luteolibacter flavescens]|uniref:1-acyl-sn-glycerol-3-phosphate acyltransferase n=1 Tax=Luteolibacter flavescens TaxID=1859460 RepID=A0ABT3FTI7_9BACT|nr:lysophospholipid acyltransferase family protein [Luteolibacter flavescens]MCW1886886.1 1-acyl-sn-glycerol-3-phosphate acyltransferase [Luteolibacter flavescens]